MSRHHGFAVRTEWTGNRGEGTATYRAYGRDHVVVADGKLHAIEGSSDRAFHGDAERWNPEELVIAALSQCHMLSFLHVAAANGLVVVEYTDDASGTLETTGDSGRLAAATLRPIVTLDAQHSDADADRAGALHERASELCFIANSVNFPVHHEVQVRVAGH
jgi:organic hydroperoxide reductase OsmC/OhrA